MRQDPDQGYPRELARTIACLRTFAVGGLTRPGITRSARAWHAASPSMEQGNALTPDELKAKLELIVETAAGVRG
jgi:hypothetical protein